MKRASSSKISCPHHMPLPGHTPAPVKAKGSFRRESDGVRLKRFFCHECQRSFSEATLALEYRQRKRHINKFLFILLASNNSMRRSAIIASVARKTVDRRLEYFFKVSERYQKDLLKNLPQVKEIHFDDMETSEHTKMKPLAVTLAVEHPSRLILSFDVASMPAKGLLAKKSRKKYGRRPDERSHAWNHVLSSVAKISAPGLLITSDSHKHYPQVIRRHLPGATHVQVKGRRGCVAGQGELKVGGWDPLFSLNHTAAMLRANICRLIRRTWCTTKRKDRLRCHIGLYVMWHNETILARQQGREKKFPFP
ncbi:MAG: hypothetical protein WCL28_09470, partial [bacterium]